MTLEFRPPFPIDPNYSPERDRLDRLNQALTNISNSSDQWRQADRANALQNLQMQLLKQESDRKATEESRKAIETTGEWGVQAPSTMTTPISGPQTFDQSIRSALDPGSPASPAPAGGMVDKFRQWQQSRRQGGAVPDTSGLSQPLVGHNEILPGLFDPQTERGLGWQGKISPGTKGLESAAKLLDARKKLAGPIDAVPLFLQSNLVKNPPSTIPKDARIVNDISASRQDTGNIAWNTATPQEKRIAVGIYNGTIRPSDIGYRERTKAVYLASEYANANGLEPLRSYSGEISGKTATAFATGKQGQNVNALNTALGHLNSLDDAFKQVGNTNQAWMNIPINKLKRITNDPAIIKLDATLNAVQGESANVFKGSGATDQEIASWRQVFNPNLTPAQALGVIQQTGSLFQSRLDALQYQRDSNMGGTSRGSLLSPHASELMNKFATPEGVPKFQYTATNAAGRKVGWDGKQWVDIP